jgi:cytochrome c
MAGKPKWAVIVPVLCGIAGGGAEATAGASLKPVLDANGCSNCHAQSEQIVGPSFDAIRNKYQNSPDAVGALFTKVRLGGTGVWGQVAMPPNPKISDEDLREVLNAILKNGPGASAPPKPLP